MASAWLDFSFTLVSLASKDQSHNLKPDGNAAFGKIELRLVTGLCK